MNARELDIIVTHERTDFDAIASLLGAALVFAEAVPVLPRQMNRNVRDFLALYKNHFRFVPADDLPRCRVRRVIIVDSRVANSPKGTQPDTEYVIIDHHTAQVDDERVAELRRALPNARELWCGATGANTTLLVEKLMEHGIIVSPVEATLLALGIYEDTGNLTYASTTSRDAAALAWLLDPARGVNLREVNEFLHHPISEEQRTLLQTLMENCEFLEIAGHQVIITTATAPGFLDELSTLAARLRDFHEPDAIFIVIDLGDVIQVVARSTTDAVDVGKITQTLGGGGHSRAAAAHVRDASLVEVRQQILDLVQETSRTAGDVRQIMSVGRPQTLDPELTIAEADERMRRWGHEGFPVVELDAAGKEHLLGVLTRREADRALSHRLGDQPVRRFMRTGQFTVHPSDSIATLRRTMIDSNWGQIPVVDDEGDIVGIVTRTDLIKLWDESLLPNRRAGEIASRLQRALAPVQVHLLELIGREVDAMNFSVYVVGGFVRDLMLDTAGAIALSLDVDIVIEGDAIAFARRMQQHYGGRVVAHKRFGTAKWLLNEDGERADIEKLLRGIRGPRNVADLPAHLDFVTARAEFYTEPTVLPTVQQGSIKLDLHRRDFTINTLALALNPDRWGQLLDFWGGLNDLRAGAVRVLHSLSFVDDPTRILRAVRYEQRFAFQIEPRTLELLADALELLDRVTPARVRHELERILDENIPDKALLRLDELGILHQIHPALRMDVEIEREFIHLRSLREAPDADPILRETQLQLLYWAVMVYPLSVDVHIELAARLGLRHDTARLMASMRRLLESLPLLARQDARPSELVAVLDEIEPAALALAPVVCDDPQVLSAIARYQTVWRHIYAELNGDDLHRMAIPRGRFYRDILTALRTARLDGLASSREEEERIVWKMIADA